MKSIGIVRRVDDLGRVVIPKTIRDTLKIKTGDVLEVFTDGSTIIIQRKDLMKDTLDTVNTLLHIINKILDINILITGTDKFLYVKGKGYDECLDKDIGSFIYDLIIKRKKIVNKNYVFLNKKVDFIMEPIIVNGDVLGSVIFVRESGKLHHEDEVLCDVVSKILINYLEV